MSAAAVEIKVLAIPADLRERPQWVCWRLEERDGKPTKVPFDPRNERKADTTDPKTWGTFEEAHIAYKFGSYQGVGFVFSEDDQFTGVDLDGCIDDDNRICGAADELLDALDSYSEVSPSGRGIHVIVRGQKPAGATCATTKVRDFKKLECYDHDRYFCFTGRHVGNMPTTIEDRQQQLEELCKRFLMPRKKAKAKAAHNGTVHATGFAGDDDALIEKARAAKDGPKFTRLWSGDTSMHDGDDSSADMGLCNLLAFWTDGDASRMDRLFRRSGLMREKWDEPRGDATYGQRTIATALEGRTEFYSCNGSTKKRASKRPQERRMEAGCAPAAHVEARDLPTIIVTDRPTREIADEATLALEKANDPPRLFQRSGELVRLDQDDKDRPIIRPVEEGHMRHELARAADWNKLSSAGRGEMKQTIAVNVCPPREITSDILHAPSWKFPTLDGITEVPVLRPDGSILREPGYDHALGLVYMPAPDLVVPDIPDQPDGQDAAFAREALEDIIDEFPFTDEASRANTLAAMLTPVIRQYAGGCAPLGAFDAPRAGTGKSLLAEVTAIIATGRDSALMSLQSGNDAECRKCITTHLGNGATVIVIDNVDGPIDHASLAAALTREVWQDRLLGTNQSVRAPQRSTWYATGNNLQLAGDMPRRVYSIRLEAPTRRPWQGREFRYPNLKDHVREHRGELIAALLTMARAWISAGMPEAHTPVLGSFEAWSRIVGGILQFAGAHHFLGNLEDQYEQAEEEDGQWAAFFAAVLVARPDGHFTTKDLIQTIIDVAAVRDALPDALAGYVKVEPGIVERVTPSSRAAKNLGQALRRLADRRLDDDGLRVIRAGDDRHTKVANWRIARD